MRRQGDRQRRGKLRLSSLARFSGPMIAAEESSADWRCSLSLVVLQPCRPSALLAETQPDPTAAQRLRFSRRLIKVETK